MASRVDREQPDARHDRVLDVASAMFADPGYDVVSLETLAQGAQVSQHYLQRLFRGRPGILFGVLERHVGRLFDRVGQKEDWPGDAQAVLHAMAAALVECIGEHDGDHRLLLEATVWLPRPMRDEIKLRLRWLRHSLELALVEALPPLAELPDRAPIVTQTLFMLLLGHAAWWRWDTPLARRDYAGAAVDMVLSGRLLM